MTAPAVVRWQFEDYWAGRTKRSTFLFTGSVQQFVVPDDVSSLVIMARGAYGGYAQLSNGVYLGGLVQGTLPVDPGDHLNIYVGGVGAIRGGSAPGTGTYNGGGHGGSPKGGDVGGGSGGGATDVRLNGTALSDRVLVAGGGGGNSGGDHRGGPGGPNGKTAYSPDGHHGGGGGTQTTPGTAGAGGGAAATSTIAGAGGDNTKGNGAGGGGGGLECGGGGGVDSNGYSYGGGGGSNLVSNFDPSQPVLNEYGTLAQAVSQLVAPSLSLSYAGDVSSYVFDINPNDGGTPSMQKNVAITQNTGPNRVNILQEGNSTAPTMEFSGVILTQQHLEAMETWFDKRVFIKLTDDLQREFYGVFSTFAPKRVRRPLNPWYHTFDATFTISAYRDASGNWRYGRVS